MQSHAKGTHAEEVCEIMQELTLILHALSCTHIHILVSFLAQVRELAVFLQDLMLSCKIVHTHSCKIKMLK